MMLALIIAFTGPYEMAGPIVSPPPTYGMMAAPMVPTYADAYAQALREGKRLAVFIACKPRDIAGVVTVGVPHEGIWKEYRPQSVSVSAPNKAGDLVWIGTTSLLASDDQIRRGVQPVETPQVRQAAGLERASTPMTFRRSPDNCST